MEKIDIYTHITPPKYLAALERMVPSEITKDIPCRWLPGLGSLDLRFKVLDENEGMKQVLSLANPPVEALLEPAQALELSKIANDEMAELVAKYPDYFVGAVACLPMNDIDLALQEADRAIKELNLQGVQMYNTVAGWPEGNKELTDPVFYPLYEKMVEYDLPIWVHPMHPNKGKIVKDKEEFAEMRVFTGTKDHAWGLIRGAFELPFETIKTVTRLVYSPVLDMFPDVKFLLHHLGSFVPYLYDRIDILHGMSQMRNEGDDMGLKRPVLDYFRQFYVDTGIHGNSRGLMCGYDFYGPEKILFGTDGPFDADLGRPTIQRTVAAVENMDITQEEKEAIFSGNARRLLHLPTA